MSQQTKTAVYLSAWEALYLQRLAEGRIAELAREQYACHDDGSRARYEHDISHLVNVVRNLAAASKISARLEQSWEKGR